MMGAIGSRIVRLGGWVLLVLVAVSPVLSQRSASAPADASEAVASLEAELKNTSGLIQRFGVLRYLPAAALAAGDPDKAERYANELQPLATEIASTTRLDVSSLSNSATHTSNIILGLIEIQKGNTSKAREHLLASGRISGVTPPDLATFGPNMLLAKKLIENGERDAVLRYLDLCAAFWRLKDGRIAMWKSKVSRGIVPDFGANNRYVTETWPR